MGVKNFQLKARLAEIPYRLRPPGRPRHATWFLSADDRARVTIKWPARYEWPRGSWIVETAKYALARLGVLQIEDTRQVHKGVIFLPCLVDGKDFHVALDYDDYPEVINQAALDECDLYLKYQYRIGGYCDRRVVPGGYITTRLNYYRFYEAYRRGNAAPEIDIAARFGTLFNGKERQRAVQLLAEAGDISFASNTGFIRYSQFLKEVGSARFGLQLPGNGPLTPRIPDFLGLGTCLVSPPLAAQLHVPLVPGEHFVEVAEDLSDLVEKLRYYLAHEDERLRIAQAGRDYFDRFLHCEQLAGYYVHSILKKPSIVQGEILE